MNILFASGCSVFPFIRGGAEHTVHLFIKYLHQQKHHCQAIGTLDNYCFTLRKRREEVIDTINRYKLPFQCLKKRQKGIGETYPALDLQEPYPIRIIDREADLGQWVEEELDSHPPQVVVTQLNGSFQVAMLAISRDIPVVCILPSLEFGSTHDDTLQLLEEKGDQLAGIVVPSQFLQEKVKAYFKLESTIIYPEIDTARYSTNALPNVIQQRPYITLVNPQPKKGLFLFIEIASLLKEQHFITVETWFATPWTLRKWIDPLTNIKILKIQDTLKDIFLDTKLLLVPSQCDEAYCRVITEAQLGGIPVIAARRGGIPEALGDGGILIEPDRGAEFWVQTIREILNHPKLFHLLSRKARDHARRIRDFRPAFQFEQLLQESVQHKGS